MKMIESHRDHCRDRNTFRLQSERSYATCLPGTVPPLQGVGTPKVTVKHATSASLTGHRDKARHQRGPFPQLPTCLYMLFSWMQSIIEETYNQGAPLSIYPKKTPVTSMCGL